MWLALSLNVSFTFFLNMWSTLWKGRGEVGFRSQKHLVRFSKTAGFLHQWTSSVSSSLTHGSLTPAAWSKSGLWPSTVSHLPPVWDLLLVVLWDSRRCDKASGDEKGLSSYVFCKIKNVIIKFWKKKVRFVSKGDVFLIAHMGTLREYSKSFFTQNQNVWSC